MDGDGPTASTSAAASTATTALLEPSALLTTPSRNLTAPILSSSLAALAPGIRLITSANLILSGRVYDQSLLRLVIEAGLGAGEEESLLLEGDIRSRLESVARPSSSASTSSATGWEGWSPSEVFTAAEDTVGEDSSRTNVVRCLVILQQARRRLDTYDEIHPPKSKAVTPRVEDIDLDDPWGEEEEEDKEDGDVPPILDDPWAEDEVAETYPPTPVPQPVQLESEPPIDALTFILQSVTLSALSLSTSAATHALRIVCHRHGSDLYPYRLAIVEAIPGWVSPADDDVQALLPGLWEDAEHESWPKGRATIPSSLLDVLAPRWGLFALNPPPKHMLPPPRPEPLSADALSEWYAARVDSLDNLGLLDAQLAWVQHGAAQGVPRLDAIGEDLSLLSRLIYDANLTPNELGRWTLKSWRDASPEDIVKAYLSNSSPGSIVGDIKRLVLPYLYVLESRAERAGKADPGLVERMLNGAVLDLDLHLALPCFEASKATLPAQQRLIKDDQAVARLALAILYGSDKTAWPTMSAIFECLPVWDVSGRDPDSDREMMETTLESLAAFIKPTVTGETHDAHTLFFFFKPLPFSSLSRALDILDVHLESGEILARYDVRVFMRTLLQSARDKSEQVTLAEKMVRRGNGGADERKWMTLWEDMGRLQGGDDQLLRGAFGMLSKEELARIFLHGLLSAGNFPVAKKVIRRLEPEGHFTPQDLEDVVLTTSKEFYMRAETGNIHTGDMKLAYECLSVGPQTTAIRAEQDFVQATSRVASFKALSSLSPSEIRYTPNKLDLVRRVLSTSDDSYRHAGIILDLTEKLGYTDMGARAEVLSMLASAAVTAGDWDTAREHVDAMVEMATPDLGESSKTPASSSPTVAAEAKPVQRDDDEDDDDEDDDEGAEGDGWGWDDEAEAMDEDDAKLDSAPQTAPKPLSASAQAAAEAEAAKVRDVTYRSCLQLGSSDYPDLGGRLALLAQAIVLAPPEEVGTILPLYHGLEARLAADPSLLTRSTSNHSQPALPNPFGGLTSLPSLGFAPSGDDTVLGSRRAAKAARMAYDLGASLNFPNLRGMTASSRSVSGDRATQRSSLDRPRGSFESGRSQERERQERDAAALFETHTHDPSVREGARRALVKGVGWLLGAEEGDEII